MLPQAGADREDRRQPYVKGAVGVWVVVVLVVHRVGGPDSATALLIAPHYQHGAGTGRSRDIRRRAFEPAAATTAAPWPDSAVTG
jgi:hypothetical protein